MSRRIRLDKSTASILPLSSSDSIDDVLKTTLNHTDKDISILSIVEFNEGYVWSAVSDDNDDGDDGFNNDKVKKELKLTIRCTMIY